MILQGRVLDLVIVLGVDILDLGLCFGQLGLVQLDNRAQPQVVTSLSQREGQLGLVHQLVCDANLLIGGGGVVGENMSPACGPRWRIN